MAEASRTIQPKTNSIKMISNFASPEELKGSGSLIKSHKDLLIDAEKKIASLELENRNLGNENEKLKWQNAQLRTAVTALAEHGKHDNDAVQKIYNDFANEQEAIYNTMVEEAKKQFLEDMKSGKSPDLRTYRRAQE